MVLMSMRGLLRIETLEGTLMKQDLNTAECFRQCCFNLRFG